MKNCCQIISKTLVRLDNSSNGGLPREQPSSEISQALNDPPICDHRRRRCNSRRRRIHGQILYAVHTGSSVGPRRNSRIPFSAGAVCREATTLPAELVTETGSTQFRK